MTEIRSISFIAMGGNLPSPAGTPLETLSAALPELARRGLRLRAVSRFFATPCFPAGAGPDYVNTVIAVEGNISEQHTLSVLHEVESLFSRVRDQRWGMRTLDLDLIAVGDAVLPDSGRFDTWRGLPLEAQMQQAPGELILPHPRLQDRAFVLVPLCDIAPGWLHPVLKKSAREMLQALPRQDVDGVVPL